MALDSLARRRFLQTATLTAGGLWLGVRTGSAHAEVLAPSGVSDAAIRARFSVFLTIAADGVVHITGPQSEMGQGTHDGLAKILAEELDADWAQVVIHLPSGDDAFRHPSTGRHRTASSDSISSYGDVMRRAGASAKGMLIAAAAARWEVPAAECVASASSVLHPPTARRLGFGALAEAAAMQPIPVDPQFKDPALYKLVGHAIPRKDAYGKVTGTAVFGIDVQLPGMLHAVLCRSPSVAGRVVSFSRDAALAMPGVLDAYPISDGIAVIARTTWHAMQAARALEVHPQSVFDDRDSLGVESEGMRTRLREALTQDDRAQVARAPAGRKHDRVVTDAALQNAARQFEWTYEVPFLAHAAMEPLNATAWVTDERAQVWAPTQHPDGTRDVIAKASGLPRERCSLQVTFLGGGFGRKWETDFVRQAVEVARGRPGAPIKLTWTREQDFRHDRFRPAHMARSRVGLDAQGRILGLHTRISGISMWRYQRRAPVPGLGDPFMTGGLIGERYAIPAPLVDLVETPEPVPVGTWRSVAHSMNGFFSESTLDDIAAVSGRDPLALRLELLAGDPRAVAVLTEAARRIGWKTPATPQARRGGRLSRHSSAGTVGRGIALSAGYGSWCAQAVELRAVGRVLHIERIVAVVDCGRVIDPGSVVAQVSGGILFGLSAAIDGGIDFADGKAQGNNFDTAPLLRFASAPQVEVHLIDSTAASGGVGEVSTPGIAPALTAAIFAATGERPRRLPLVTGGYSFA
jgi:CO/xanthine dehydrogenase Mo-binding subunit